MGAVRAPHWVTIGRPNARIVRHATLADARLLLLRHFGFADFRPAQREVVRSVLSARDTLAVLPTGAGKSACFQVPALLLDGITVVVSPLISLMTDQVAACQRRGIAAAALTSATSAMERLVVMESLRSRSIRLLYLSPERLAASAATLRQQIGTPAMLAVDEAHCISEWGPDFRPAYRQLGVVRRQLGMPPVAALTGSATPDGAAGHHEATGVPERRAAPRSTSPHSTGRTCGST